MEKGFFTVLSESDLANLIEGALQKGSNQKIESETPEIINREELCKRLSITRPTVIRWEKKGAIPCFRIGSNVRYNWKSVIEALEKQKTR